MGSGNFYNYFFLRFIEGSTGLAVTIFLVWIRHIDILVFSFNFVKLAGKNKFPYIMVFYTTYR